MALVYYVQYLRARSGSVALFFVSTYCCILASHVNESGSYVLITLARKLKQCHKKINCSYGETEDLIADEKRREARRGGKGGKKKIYECLVRRIWIQMP